MTKHLKLKVKNTQLAAALKQSKEKKEKQLTLQRKESEKVQKPSGTPKKKPLNLVAGQQSARDIKSEMAKIPVVPPTTPVEPDKPEEEVSIPKAGQPTPTSPPSRSLPDSQPPKTEKRTPPKTLSFENLKKREKEKEPAPGNKTAPKTNIGHTPPNMRRQQNLRFDTRDRQGLRLGEERTWRRRPPRHKIPKTSIETVRPKELSIHIPVSVKDLAQAMKLKASELISKLLMQGVTTTINDLLDDETTIQLLGQEFDCEISIDTSEERRLRITDKTIREEIQETDPAKLELRAPVITFMGHVDHGKTALIDCIRKSNIAGEEAGAITQHIGAFKCHREHGDITILDTPGHEAFGLMRQRGSALTDVLVLVIAGDEGIMPQTKEAITLAKQSDIPVIVAINKSDKPAFDAKRVHCQLADHELLSEAWGGSVITVNCSATTGEGISQLIEMLILQSEILELKANPNTRARGTVLESELHKGFGPIVTLLVQNGTLHLSNALIFEDIYARVKTMHNEYGKVIESAGPSTPVKITGLSGIPSAGCEFIVVESEKEARKLSEKRASGAKRSSLKRSRGELENLMSHQQELSEKKVLNFILRADVQGSVEAVRTSLLGIPTKKVELVFISEGVGEISESDVKLAAASNAVIIGFNTHVENHAEELIKHCKVVVKKRNIIYQIIDDVKELMLASLDKIVQESEVGTAEIKQIFKSSHFGTIAGCLVTGGTIKRNQYAKLFREDKVIWEGNIISLKHIKEDVKEVGKGGECGILLERCNHYQEGDLIKTFEISYIQQSL